MKIIRNIQQMAKMSLAFKGKQKTIGFVPTMGALHNGHLSLIRKARRETDIVVVSIFVNPAQFGPKEDFRRYPRTLARDVLLCRKAGVNIIFYPKAEDMYPEGYKTFVTVEDLSNSLCGKFRPGHFSGVTTVVTKLVNIVHPDVAYFGQKDAQQAVIIRRMITDLNIHLKVKVLPTVREKDGLALSSRNRYLNEQERKDALVLSCALHKAQKLLKKGERKSENIIRVMRTLIGKKRNIRIDYISIVAPEDLNPVTTIRDKALIALAVWIGKTRLIDNITVRV